MSKEDHSRPSDFDTSERFEVKEDSIEEDPEEAQMEFEVYVKDLETNETSMITFFSDHGVEAVPAVKTGDFLYGAVEEAKAWAAKKGFDIGPAEKVV